MNPITHTTADGQAAAVHSTLDVPDYIERHYWWAYARYWAVRVFERPWLINLILYGNYNRLRDAALAEFEGDLSGKTLKISCCYGSLTPKLAERVQASGGMLDVIDILPMQLENAARKTAGNAAVQIQRMNAAQLDFSDDTFDNVLLFFLLHEMPQDYKERAMNEALRVLKPSGKLVIVDFGKPKRWNIFFRFFWLPMLGILEPFAIPLWRHELEEVIPEQMSRLQWTKESYFGRLFQKRVGKK